MLPPKGAALRATQEDSGVEWSSSDGHFEPEGDVTFRLYEQPPSLATGPRSRLQPTLHLPTAWGLGEATSCLGLAASGLPSSPIRPSLVLD